MERLSSELPSFKIDRSPAREGGGVGRYIVWLVLIAAIGGGAAYAYPHVEAEIFKTTVKTTTIVDVSPTLAATSLTATGYVIAELRSKVGSNVPGRIAKLLVKEGSVVKQGDVGGLGGALEVSDDGAADRAVGDDHADHGRFSGGFTPLVSGPGGRMSRRGRRHPLRPTHRFG